jgi:hypothetical protein
MAVSDVLAKNSLLVAVIGVLGVYIVLQYDSTLFGLLGRSAEGFKSSAGMKSKLDSKMVDNRSAASGSVQGFVGQTASNPNVDPKKPNAKLAADKGLATNAQLTEQPCKPNEERNASGACVPKSEGFADLAAMEGPAGFGSASAPAGCYPRDQLTPVQLLPADQDSIYAQQNPMGVGSLKGKNFLSAGALIGVNTVGQTLRNANLQLRSEPPNPQVSVSIFNQSTIQSDVNRRPLEVGGV